MGRVFELGPFFPILKQKNTWGKKLILEKLLAAACNYTVLSQNSSAHNYWTLGGSVKGSMK